VKKDTSFDPNDDVSNKLLLGELCTWIKNNLDTLITLVELTSHSQLGLDELNYLFKKYMGTTPMNYVRMLQEEGKKTDLFDKNRVSPIFWGKD
jgi:transcriptional regulator GlxA family with amidase domain